MQTLSKQIVGRLDREALADVADVADVARRPITVLQYGSGNFLRAFVDWMIQQTNNQGLTDMGVAIAYATPRHADRPDPLRDQDGLYHVCLEGIKDGQATRTIELVDVVQQVVDPYSQFEDYLATGLSPDLKIIVSNTTEAGIVYDGAADLQATPPTSFPAKLTQLLFRRYEKFAGDPAQGLAIVPCELIENNGDVLRDLILRHAEEADLGEGFVAWLMQSCHFYNTLVDRIVPGFPGDDAPAIWEEIGFDDRALVKGEYFHVFAIQGDDYLAQLLPFQEAGLNVLHLDNIAAFRDKKVRILNGPHTAMAQIGLQLGCEIVGDAVADPDLSRYIDQLVATEILPSINEDPEELRAFADKIVERFSNPYLRHALADIDLNSISKWKARNLPVILDRWVAGAEAPLSVFALSALLMLDSGCSEARGFEAQDDAESLTIIRDNYDPADLGAWVATCVAQLDLLPQPDPAVQARLIAEGTLGVQLIAEKGMRAALTTLL